MRHQLIVKVNYVLSDISDNDWKEKAKTETFISGKRIWKYKSIALIFHDRDVTSDGETKGYIVTWFLNLEIHYQLHL